MSQGDGVSERFHRNWKVYTAVLLIAVVSTAVFKWLLSTSQAATTRQSFICRNSRVLPGPCMPQPTTPTAMRCEEAAPLVPPNTRPGTMTGAVSAAPVTTRNCRRLTLRWCLTFINRRVKPTAWADFKIRVEPGQGRAAPWLCAIVVGPDVKGVYSIGKRGALSAGQTPSDPVGQ